jgi:hypothetical protein
VSDSMVTCKNEKCGVGFEAPVPLVDAALHHREAGPAIGQCPSCLRSYSYELADLGGAGSTAT